MSAPVFKINPNPTFSEFVSLTVPGHALPARISITFRHKNQADLNEWFQLNKDRPVVDALDGVIAGWGDPAQNEHGEEEPGIAPIGADGERLPYTREALASLLANYSAATAEITRGYVVALKASRVKN